MFIFKNLPSTNFKNNIFITLAIISTVFTMSNCNDNLYTVYNDMFLLNNAENNQKNDKQQDSKQLTHIANEFNNDFGVVIKPRIIKQSIIV